MSAGKNEYGGVFFLVLLQVTDQEEEAGAGQPEVPSSVTIDVKVLSGQVTVGVKYL